MTKKVTHCIQSFRQGKSITQEDLAQAVGVTRQTIIAIEKKRYTPSLVLAMSLANYFGVSVESMFQISDEI